MRATVAGDGRFWRACKQLVADSRIHLLVASSAALYITGILPAEVPVPAEGGRGTAIRTTEVHRAVSVYVKLTFYPG